MWRIILGLAALLTGLALWLFWADRAPPIAVNGAAPSEETIEKGEYLARAGNCIACHTVPGNPEYSGGRRIATPFGNVYSSNLTPDNETGIGQWSDADFWRAMRHGISRDGRRLYPAFPYSNYSRVKREDSDALFAYLKSLPAVRQPQPEPQLRFPYNTGLALRLWRALFFKPGRFEADPQRSTAWNRGAYLVEGLGHCNACHTARGFLGNSLASAEYAGGPVPMLGWDALPLTNSQPMSDKRASEMARLLKHGVSERNVTSGPMAEVVFHSLQHLADDDIAAMVTYIRSLPPGQTPASEQGLQVGEQRKALLMKQGAPLYSEHCADCHGEKGEGHPFQYPALADNQSVVADSANNIIRSLMYGGFGPSTKGNPRPYGMPPYAQQMSAEDMAAVLTYIRNAWGNEAAAVSPLQIRRLR